MVSVRCMNEAHMSSKLSKSNLFNGLRVIQNCWSNGVLCKVADLDGKVPSGCDKLVRYHTTERAPAGVPFTALTAFWPRPTMALPGLEAAKAATLGFAAKAMALRLVGSEIHFLQSSTDDCGL